VEVRGRFSHFHGFWVPVSRRAWGPGKKMREAPWSAVAVATAFFLSTARRQLRSASLECGIRQPVGGRVCRPTDHAARQPGGKNGASPEPDKKVSGTFSPLEVMRAGEGLFSGEMGHHGFLLFERLSSIC
jgi:hypothetical protein